MVALRSKHGGYHLRAWGRGVFNEGSTSKPRIQQNHHLLLHTLGPNTVVPLLIYFTQEELPGNVIWYQ